MPQPNDLDLSDARAVARYLCAASDREFQSTFHRLRARRELTPTVHSLSVLLADIEHGAVARAALHRLGLDQGG